MCNYYKSISSILLETKSISTFLIDAEKYYGHTGKQSNSPPEKLAEHIELVQKYFGICCRQNGLDHTIDLLIQHFLIENKISDENKCIGNFVKELFLGVIVYHDYGKVNENFQADKRKMNNPYFTLIPKHPLGTHHSALGAYLYITTYLNEMSNRLPSGSFHVISLLILSLSYNIFKHHNKKLSDKIHETVVFTPTDVDTMKKYLLRYQFNLHENFSSILPKQTHTLLETLHILNTDFCSYALLKLNFSLLTASDYLATNEYMSTIKLRSEHDFGLINDGLRKKVIENIQTLQSYNKIVYKKYSENYSFENPVEQRNQNLNILRQEMAIKVIQNIRKYNEKRLFYIEAPTGGGKTNLSMIATAELLKANPELNKVFYVFPFTTLITQTYRSIIETLGLSPDEITQLHSKAGVQNKETNTEDETDAQYGSEKRNFIDNLFINYPFCVLSHIKFFDILKTNEKETNYLLHRLANSIVVIDELQSYNPENWDKLIYFITNYSSFFNIRFILMSATLPKLGNLKVFKDVPDFIYLLGDDAKEMYFLNPNFKNRVAFNFSLIEDEKFQKKTHHDKLDYLSDFVITKSKQYSDKENGITKPKGSVFSVIEFIFKKSASKFYDIMQLKQGEEPTFDEILVLSGTILDHRRKQIINFLKNKQNRSKKILLITTQVVEAGVDIDMDLGFKDLSLIDSDEQLAGRINRNVNKPQCELYLFKLDEAKRIYGNDERFEFTRDKLNNEDYKEILEKKDFDKLYDIVFKKIDRLNSSKMMKNFSNYLANIKLLNFQKVSDEFKLIDQDNLSIFVPINISKYIEGERDNDFEPVFSDYELSFLKANDVDVEEKHIKGSDVFSLYMRIIQNKNHDFIKGKIEIKALQGILSKFVFSVFKGKETVNDFRRFGDEEKKDFGFVYLEHWKDVYDEKFGVNEDAFKESNFI